jgi:hypothetical protein
VTVERIRGSSARAEVVEYLRGREPESTAVLAALVRPRRSRHQKVWVVRGSTGIGGVLVSTRFCFDRWHGSLLLDDLSHAQEMATALDRSNLWTVTGPFDALDAVLPQVTRYRSSGRTRLHVVPYVPRSLPAGAGGFSPSDFSRYADFTLRRATPRDRKALVALYTTDPRIAQLPRSRVPGIVRRALPHTLVAASPNGITGAIMSTPGIEYNIVNRLVVDPAGRGGRLSYVLALHAALAALADGRGCCGFRSEPEDPRGALRMMRSSYSESLDFGESQAWLNVSLWPPRRFRGHNRLRFALERLESRLSEAVAAPEKSNK